MSLPTLSLSKSGAAYVTYRVGKGKHSGGGTGQHTTLEYFYGIFQFRLWTLGSCCFSLSYR